ncbi:uncharacterized protein (TIGR00297 family) [Anoxybacillus vitaminiphilus]|uniref:Uncharacterized protein (TIGR00297 family) n=2 Tax=Paranoxybacillus vitaminiphilus TaxID=581036 RepID=A0A327YPD3_9BACL|nr:DUF92 domain-containing protein [Anoxybacillus vitaminiphilus]RAK22392.1 uncharacterized protein (TIGR00297 family) [Anoxybacillus vitaminiphilus]
MMNEWAYIAVTFIVAFGGWLVRSLSVSGAVAAFFIGLFISLGFESKGLIMLGAFFVSSSLWSKFQKHKKIAVFEKVEKGDERDYVQVLANGSVPALISLIDFFSPSALWLELFIVSLAAANSDTWASEIGSVSKQPPRLITTWKTVERGTSGGVTLLGTVAAIGGALFVGIVSFVLWHNIHLVFAGLFGFFGSMIDTWMGAVCQVNYRCAVCGLETEKRHHCGQGTIRIKGWHFMNNDIVNWLSILSATMLYFFVTKLQ